MSGKSYTMKEMRSIVEYLAEHKVYNEIRGRKMWMDFANSNITNRTWQSLKETFLKRILPDIHNPYYKLSVQQISSFRQGYDVEARLNNKLEIRSTTPESNKLGVNEKNTEKPDNLKSEDVLAGEDLKQATLRESTETLVLDSCYETVEDIQKVLQSPTDDIETTEEAKPTKSMRELITYSEPLTPMLQGVIDDFATDDEGDEPKMQIVEPDEITNKRNDANEENPTIEISDSEGNDVRDQINEKNTKSDVPQSTDKNVSSLTEVKENKKSATLLSSNEGKSNNTEENEAVVKNSNNNSKTSCELTQSNSGDTLLPGNQEAFAEKFNTGNKKANKEKTLRSGRKRASSQDYQPKSKKRILAKEKSISDTDTCALTNGNVNISKSIISAKIPHPKQPIPEESSAKSPIIKSSLRPIQSKEIVEPTEPNTIIITPANIENPCLKNVNLYAEEFSTTKYSDSETSRIEDEKKNNKNEHRDNKKNKIDDNIKKAEQKSKKVDDTNKKEDVHEKKINNDESAKDKIVVENVKIDDKIDKEKSPNPDFRTSLDIQDDVVILKSHSDSVSDNNENHPNKNQQILTKQQKDSVLANMFGFSSGGASKGHRRKTDYRQRTISRNKTHNYGNVSSASSDWTSDTGSEYVSSPPRQYGRKGRYSRKYLKPRPAPILSLEEEGGLFVMYGKKIYPIVKDGKTVKNFVSYTPEDDVDPEEAFWKLKYVEERKKTAELTKLLSQAREKQKEPSPVPPPVLPTTTQPMIPTYQPDPQQELTKVVPEQAVTLKQPPNPEPVPEEKKTVKIKFIKHNEEVQLEGHWSHLNPVLAQVAQLFNREPPPANVHCAKSEVSTSVTPTEPVAASGISTPIEDVVEKVNRRESDIAKEIEKYYKEESKSPEKASQTESVTKRRGRPRKISPTAAPPSPAKKAKMDVEAPAQKVDIVTSEKIAGTDNNTAITTRRRSPKKTLTAVANENDTVNARRNTLRNSNERTDITKAIKPAEVTHDDDVRYKLPPLQPTRRSYSNRVTKNTSQRKSKSAANLKILPSSPENTLAIPMYIIQGHGDPKIRSSSVYLKGKRPTSLPISSRKDNYATRFRTRTHSNLTYDIIGDSSNSFQNVPLKSLTFQNSNLTSGIYTSESSQLLMNKGSLLHAEKLGNIANISPTTEHVTHPQEEDQMADVLKLQTDYEYSSNTSMPTSPVLSIVENISISKSMLDSANTDDFQIDDKWEENNAPKQINLNELMTPDIDVPMPLMKQYCGIEKSCYDGIKYHYNLNAAKSAVTESLLNKIISVNIDDTTLSESLNSKLKALLLESAKKGNKANPNVSSEMEDIEMTDNVNREMKNIEMRDQPLSKVVTVGKTRRRTSTPRKRKSTRKVPFKNAECIVEEHMESCSRAGRQSCPPVIIISEPDDVATNTLMEMTEYLTVTPTKRKKRKDIIKVKIVKPKSKTLDISCGKKNTRHTNFTDSGINDTDSDIITENIDSVDLIHNHSETCLNAHDCMGDSVQFVKESSNQSVISLYSDSAQSDITMHHNNKELKNRTPELFSDDAQHSSDIEKGFRFIDPKQLKDDTATCNNMPTEPHSSFNSLITEDLSEESSASPVQNTKWYLLSEDDTTNTNHANYKHSEAISCSRNLEQTLKNSPERSPGAYLEQIFQALAIPNLSTVTEISRESGDSKNAFDISNNK